MVDLVQYARFLETDLAFVKEMAPKFEAGTYSAGFRPKGKEWVDFTAQTVLLYKRMILTQDAALMATQTKMAQNKLAEVEA
jgi:hypothetical protein